MSVPICSFTIPFTREFAESYPFPPPATVYGMLLSYIGELDRNKYVGTRLTIAVTKQGLPSLVIRKTRRVKNSDLNSPDNLKPDYQTLLTGLEFLVGLYPDTTRGQSLWLELERCYYNPEVSRRFGGLSCGESHNLVDQFSMVHAAKAEVMLDLNDCFLLQPDESGEWSIPVWVDHVGSEKTVWARATLIPAQTRERISLFEIVDKPGSLNP